MLSPASELSRALASNVEAVCRRYLSNGRRHGAYWTVGDVLNTPGGSLYVRLTGPTFSRGAAGHWTDAATGQHGDLLDLIALNCGLSNLRDAMDEAPSRSPGWGSVEVGSCLRLGEGRAPAFRERSGRRRFEAPTASDDDSRLLRSLLASKIAVSRRPPLRSGPTLVFALCLMASAARSASGL